MYLAVKHLHLFTLSLSLGLFIARWLASFKQAAWLRWKITKILPHVNDTVLLASGLGLSLTSGLYPFAQAWLTVKLLLVIAYIVLGYIALKWVKTAPQRLVAGLAALSVFGLIVFLAITKPLLGT